jgi:hypothetical protein
MRQSASATHERSNTREDELGRQPHFSFYHNGLFRDVMIFLNTPKNLDPTGKIHESLPKIAENSMETSWICPNGIQIHP